MNNLFKTTFFLLFLFLFFTITQVDASSINVDISTEVDVSENLESRAKTKIKIQNNDLSKIIGGYDFTIPFHDVRVNSVKSEGKNLQFQVKNLEFDILSINFQNQALEYGEIIDIEVDFSSNKIIAQSIDGLWELFVPIQNFDESTKHNIKIKLPQSFENLNFVGKEEFISNLTINISDFNSHYFAWIKNNNMWRVDYTINLESSGFINFPRVVNQDVILLKELNLQKAFVDNFQNLWVEVDAMDNQQISLGVSNTNNFNENINYGANIDFKADFKNLENFEKFYFQFFDDYEIKAQRDVNFDNSLFEKNLSNKTLNNFEACIYLVSAAQNSGLKGYLEYGYFVGKFLPGIEPTLPYVWCVIHDEQNFLIFDPFLHTQSGIYLRETNYNLRIPWGVVEPNFEKSENNFLGLKNKNYQQIKINSINPSFDDKQINYDLSISLPTQVYFGFPFDLLLKVTNKSNKILEIQDIFVNKEKIKIEDIILLPQQNVDLVLNNLTLGKFWGGSDNQITVEANIDNLYKSQTQKVKVSFHPIILGVGLFTVLVILILLIYKLSKYIVKRTKK
ncbi:MAG: hypothetical protein KatS3mg085_652 [Candidatus Dojkabacteria bacterium]|nr:MAG: hypothetical protein KatS3mg085_652 [Candidatus Dojkabacteria bacterium]